ncbi:unnamed protein product [Echinostoma caproni]|uniref:dolichol kinase n=1 Tax=Echinostoma caproni TaxID=27848 RepID=A0A183AQJ0_9TREM|nr:unnamed protein product [Echinostoma caproni]
MILFVGCVAVVWASRLLKKEHPEFLPEAIEDKLRTVPYEAVPPSGMDSIEVGNDLHVEEVEDKAIDSPNPEPPKIIVQCLSDLLDPFRDERDSGELIFTPIALLLGLSIPLWWPLTQTDDGTIELGKLCDTPKLHPGVWSGVLSIAIGDSMAALVGRAWGRIRWPGTHRTLMGSTASFLSQVCHCFISTNLRVFSTTLEPRLGDSNTQSLVFLYAPISFPTEWF